MGRIEDLEKALKQSEQLFCEALQNGRRKEIDFARIRVEKDKIKLQKQETKEEQCKGQKKKN